MFNKLWVRSVLLFFTFILFVIAATVAGIVGFLYYQKDKDFSDQQDENASLQEKIDELEAGSPADCPDVGTSECVGKDIIFEDKGRGIKVTFPPTWKQSLNTEIGEDFIYPEDGSSSGKIISGYELTLSKGTTKMIFSKVLQAIDGFPNGFSESDYEIVEVSSDLIRYRANGETVWRYADVVDCASLDADLFGDLTGSDYCASPFFPGFGDSANSLIIEGNPNASVLNEADEIAISALN